MSEALRSVFAEFGITLDDTQLAGVVKKVDGAAAKVRAFPTLHGRVDLDAVEKGTKDLRDRVDAVKVGFERALGQKLQAQLSRAVPGFDKLAARLGLNGDKAAEFGRIFTRISLGVVAGLAAMTAGALAFAHAFEGDAAALRQGARDAGVTTTQFQELTFAGERAGISADTMRGALAGLNDGLAQAARGVGGPISAFHRLGVRVRDAHGQVRSTSDVMDDLARVLPRVQNPMRRLALAQEIFGSSARDMLQVLHEGAGGLKDYRGELEALGGGVTAEASEASRRFGAAQVRLRYAFDGVRSSIMVSLAPAVTWLTERIARVTGFLARVTRNSDLFRVALTALGVAGAAAALPLILAWAPVIAPFLAAGLAVVALGLAFDDLSVFIRGGDSVLGDFLDTAGGIGTAASASRGLRDAWDGVKAALGDVPRAVDEAVTAHNAGVSIMARMAREVLGPAWASVAQTFGAALAPIREEVSRFFEGVVQRIARLADSVGLAGLARRVRAALTTNEEAPGDVRRGTAVGRLGLLAQDVTGVAALPALVGEWRNILTSRPRAAVPVPAPTRAGRAGANVTNNRTTTNHITVNGAQDPRAVADEIERRAREQRDASHPLDAEDG